MISGAACAGRSLAGGRRRGLDGRGGFLDGRGGLVVDRDDLDLLGARQPWPRPPARPAAVTRARIPDVPGVMTSASSFSTSSRWARLRALPAAAPATPRVTAPATRVAGRKTAATTPPTMPHLRPGPGAVVGHLLDVELAVVVGLDDEDAVDVERAVDLGHQQVVVDGPGGGRVGEAGDDQGVVALDGDGSLGQDAVLVGDGAADHDDVVVRGRGRGLLVSSDMSILLPCSASRFPVFARIDRSSAWRPEAAIERQRTPILARDANRPADCLAVTTGHGAYAVRTRRSTDRRPEGRRSTDEPTDSASTRPSCACCGSGAADRSPCSSAC